MRGTAAGAGRTLGVVCLIGLALLCATALGLNFATSLEMDVAALALGASTVALIGLATVQSQASRTRGQQEKISEELDTLSQTLLRIEGTLAALDGSGSKAKSTLNDVAGDVHSLSQVVKSLAEAMAIQDREIITLKERSDAPLSFRATSPADAVESPVPPAPLLVPSFLPPAHEAATSALEENLIRTKPAAAPEPDGGGAILAAARSGDIDLHAQAIVNLPQRRERIYESYPLLDTGEEALLPSQYTAALASAGALAAFELNVVGRTLVFAHRLAAAGSDARVGVSLSRASLEDRAFLRRLDALIEDHEAAARRLVIDVPQECWSALGTEMDALGRIRRHGVTFGLKQVTDENLNPPALARLGVRHVRLETKRLLEAIDSDGAHADLVTLIGALSRSGIEVIADGIEDDVVIPELIDIGIPLAQGLALGIPCPVDALLERPSRPAATAKAPAAPPPPPKPDGSGPPQGSLRDFLRRAG